MEIFSERFERLGSLADLESVAACERNFEALLVAERESSETNSVERSLYIALLLLLNARTKTTAGKFLEASEYLKEAEAKIAELAEVPPSLRLLRLIERSRLSVAEKIPSQARNSLSEAWAVAIPGGFARAAMDIARLMAEIEPQKLQLEWIKKGIEIGEGTTDLNAKRALDPLYLSLGWKRFEARQFAEAIELFEKVSKNAGRPEGATKHFAAEWAIGKTLRITSRVEEALARQLALLTEYDLAGERSGDLYEEIAECLLSLKRPNEAERYFDLAYREHLANPPAYDRLPQDMKRLKTLGKSK